VSPSSGRFACVRILLLADTHLGFDLPSHPRVDRRRRGDDFFANYHRALAPALAGEVDLVVHGGDLLFRSRVQPWLVQLAFEPLLRVAARVPVFLVPGNHERSRIPFPLLGAHRNIHVFDRPRSFTVEVAGRRVTLSGFPFVPDVAEQFPMLVEAAGLFREPADVRLLCLHQTVEGARVGPSGYTFRSGRDVLRCSQVPRGLDALLCGHIHRAQVLTRDLAGRPLPAPVFYPGSIERTSRAEREETKGYLLLDLERPGTPWRWSFVTLPARPMVDLVIAAKDANHALEAIRTALEGLDAHALVRVRLPGLPGPGLSDARLRALAPATMTIELFEPERRVPPAPRR